MLMGESKNGEDAAHVGCQDEGRGVGDDRVDDDLGADGLMRRVDATFLDVKADAAVVDIDSLIGPSPSPIGKNGGLSIIDREVTNYDVSRREISIWPGGYEPKASVPVNC